MIYNKQILDLKPAIKWSEFEQYEETYSSFMLTTNLAREPELFKSKIIN